MPCVGVKNTSNQSWLPSLEQTPIAWWEHHLRNELNRKSHLKKLRSEIKIERVITIIESDAELFEQEIDVGRWLRLSSLLEHDEELKTN